MFESNSYHIKQYYNSYFTTYVKFIFLLTVIGFIERCFFAAYHNHITSQLSAADIAHSLLYGLKFDLALAGFVALLVFIFVYILKRLFTINESRVVRFFAYLSGSLVFFVQGGDIIYFSDAARHLGYEITDTLNDAPYLLSTAWTIYKFPLLFHVALYVPVLFFIRTIFGRNTILIRNKLRGRTSLNHEGALLVAILLSIILVRGGFQSIPLEPLHAQQLSDSHKATLALNGSYNALFNLINKDQVKAVEIRMPKGLDVETTLRSMYPQVPTSNTTRQEWKPNIIFIMLESWPAMYMKSYGYDKDTTPFFDSLRKKSLTTLEMIAGGHRTTEGMFASLCSAQNPLGQTIAQSQLQNYEYRCLPHMLRDKGYHTAFFQGSNKNTSGTGAFAQLLGFTDSFGKADITERNYEENDWGVYDQDLYQYVYEALKTNDAPVLFGINTNTTHDIAIPENITPAFERSASNPKTLNSINFADQALQDFFNKVENDKDVGDTLWVIFADHTAGLKTSRLNNYRIPFLVYNKERVTAHFVERVASQRDIAPTILDLLGYNSPAHFSGKTLNGSEHPPYFADYYHAGVLGWIEGDELIEIQLTNTEKISCFDYMSDKLQKNYKPCSPSASSMRNKALTFTSKMQSQIFDGQTLNWNSIKNDN